MATTARDMETTELPAAIPTKRAREEPDEDELEEAVEMDIVKRYKSNYWDDPAANPDILQRYGALMSQLDAEDNENERFLRAIDRYSLATEGAPRRSS
jgi:hypothetical protein